jgi:hypothetical protein
VNNKQRKTLELIFKDPVQPNIRWADIEMLFKGFGGIIEEREGSRICVRLQGVKLVFHRPHPKKVTDKGAIKSVRKFLKDAGIHYDEI